MSHDRSQAEIMPRLVIHPGEVLADELAEIGFAATELSRQIDVWSDRVAQILHGRRAISSDAAFRLGNWVGGSAQFRLDLHSAYDIRIAPETAGEEIARLATRPG